LRRYKQILVELGSFWRGVAGLVTLSTDFTWKGTSPPTIVGIIKLSCFCYFIGADRVILCSFVWIGYQRVTDVRMELL